MGYILREITVKSMFCGDSHVFQPVFSQSHFPRIPASSKPDSSGGFYPVTGEQLGLAISTNGIFPVFWIRDILSPVFFENHLQVKVVPPKRDKLV